MKGKVKSEDTVSSVEEEEEEERTRRV